MPKKHILLVDDEKDFAETMVMLLQMRGFLVTVVHSGQEGLDKAQERPDLILLDVMMPKMNGYEVCTKLRENDVTKNIPVIMLTAKTQAQDKVEGLQIGADDYITKTSDAEELFARIEAVLRRSGLSEEIDKEKAQLIEELKRIINNELVQMVFQPIYFLNPQKLFAYEVLTRGPKDSLLQNPDKLFKSALRYGMLFELELLCRKKTLEKLGANVKENLFFFNSNPYLIEAERLDEVLRLYDDPKQVVIEVTERSEIKDFPSFCENIRGLKKKGFRISLDDVGSGYASLDAVAELDPDFVKIDLPIIRDINTNPKKQNLVKAIMMICKSNNIVSIGEGIETEDELKTLIELGVEAGQGYFLGRPNPELVKSE